MSTRAITIALYILTTFLILCGLSGDFIGLFTPYWWTIEIQIPPVRKEEVGVLRSCTTKHKADKECKIRDDIFEFEYLTDNKEIRLDIILILLLVAAVFSLLSLICMLNLLCCFKNNVSWKRGTLCNMVLSAIAALSTFGCLIYVETASEKIPYEKSWTPTVVWCAATALLAGSILSSILTCLPPKGQHGGHVNVQPYRLSEKPRNSFWNSSYTDDSASSVNRY